MKYNKLVAGESVHQEKTLDGLNIGSQGICDYFRSKDTVELLSRGKPMAHQIHSYSEVSIHLIFLSARLSFYRRQADDCCCCCFLLLLLLLAAAAASCCCCSILRRKKEQGRGSNNARERFVCLAGCQIVVEWLPTIPFAKQRMKRCSVEVFNFYTRMTSHWAFLQRSKKR